MVGEVVGLREHLQWFEDRPLLGRRIVVTRSRAQASDLVQALSDLGAECLECPTIQVAPPDDVGPLDRAIADLAAFDWIVFTSVNGVSGFFERLFGAGKDVRALGRLRTAAIGPATAERLKSFGLSSDIVPETFRAESIVAAFRKERSAARRSCCRAPRKRGRSCPRAVGHGGRRPGGRRPTRPVPADPDAWALADRLEANGRSISSPSPARRR